MGDGVHQVGFAQAHATIQKQRIEGDRATFGHAAGGGMGQFIGFADNETIKRKARVKGRNFFFGFCGGFGGFSGAGRWPPIVGGNGK